MKTSDSVKTVTTIVPATQPPVYVVIVVSDTGEYRRRPVLAWVVTYSVEVLDDYTVRPVIGVPLTDDMTWCIEWLGPVYQFYKDERFDDFEDELFDDFEDAVRFGMERYAEKAAMTEEDPNGDE